MLLSFFEFVAVILLIYGFINEKKVAAFEQKIFNIWRSEK
jgi:hypothetical protein